MKKFIQLTVFMFLLYFIASPYTEARTVLTNDVNLDFVQEGTIFHFIDGPIKCVGTFSPNASLNCHQNHSQPSTPSYSNSQSTFIYESFISKIHAGLNNNLALTSTTVIVSAIKAQIIDHQICYFATGTEGRTNNVDKYLKQNQEGGRATSIATSCLPL